MQHASDFGGSTSHHAPRRSESQTPDKYVSPISQRIASMRPTSYCAGGLLPQLPFDVPRDGPVLVIDLWSGYGGTVLAMLSMGIQCVVVTAESDEAVNAQACATLKGCVHLGSVDNVLGSDLVDAVRRRRFKSIFIGGGAPCQGNSSLNKHRTGLKDMRTQGAAAISRICGELQTALRKSNVESPVIIKWIENVASCPKDVVEFYTHITGGPPVLIDAAQWGWVTRKRLFWGSADGRNLSTCPVTPPPNVSIEWNHAVAEGRCPRVRWHGKPYPKEVRVQGGYSLRADPTKVCAQDGRGAMYTFTRQFFHPSDRCARCSREAVERFYADNCQFPPDAYEEISLAWKGDQWRTLTSEERAQIMGFPPQALGCGRKYSSADWRRHEMHRNCWIGNGFHAPSIMLFIVLMFQIALGDASTCPSVFYAAREDALRQRIRGTVWEPGFSIPGLLTPSELCLDIREQLSPVTWSAGVWLQVEARMRTEDLRILQLYWMDATVRGCNPYEMGPEIPNRTQVNAQLGQQRAASSSNRGLHPILPAGLGKEEHMRQACLVASPYSGTGCVEDDVIFASRQMIAFGEFHERHRLHVDAAMDSICNALRPLEMFVSQARSSNASAVAKNANPLLMAAMSALIRWPDRDQPLRYVQGFRIVGDGDITGVFREVRHEAQDPDSLLGTYASQCVDQIAQSAPDAEFAEEMWSQSIEEVKKGFAKPMRSRKEMDAAYGPGGWLPMERFMVRQPSGKLRCIDNGRKFGHNDVSSLFETIFTTSLDFVPSAIQAMLRIIRTCGFFEEVDWEQHALELGVLDLVDAYRYVPVAECDNPFSITAVYCPKTHQWMFMQLMGHAFGLGAAVNNFNRRPSFLVAVARRTLGIVTSAYFDDFGVVDFAVSQGRAIGHLSGLLHRMGVPESLDKRFGMAPMRIYLGQVLSTFRMPEEGTFVVDTKPGQRDELAMEAIRIAEAEEVSRTDANKLRGKAGWVGAATHGRCGRFALQVLTKYQYSKSTSTKVSPEDCETLRVFAEVARRIPCKEIRLLQIVTRPMVVYSDASFEPGVQPRLGLVVCDWHNRLTPRGYSSLISDSFLEGLIQRKSQILACEAVAVPQALVQLRQVFYGRDVTWYIDNEAACSSMIRGSSRPEDVGLIAGVAHLLMMTLGCRVWFEWIDSDSNIADGLSRAGLMDEWTVAQDWILEELSPLEWNDIHEVTDNALRFLDVGS